MTNSIHIPITSVQKSIIKINENKESRGAVVLIKMYQPFKMIFYLCTLSIHKQISMY